MLYIYIIYIHILFIYYMYMYMYIFQLIYPGLTYLVQKTKGFLTFSGGIEMWHWTKMG